MAEAHALISLTITPDGFGFIYNFNVANQIFRSILRSWKRRYGRLKNLFLNNVYPLSYRSLFIFLFLSALIFYLKVPTLHKIQLKMGNIFKRLIGWSENDMYVIFITGMFSWFVNIILVKYALRSLLRYNGWIFEERKNFKLQTKLWMFVLGWFVGNQQLKSYQYSLPRLPLPDLKDSVQKYLKSAQCLYDADEMEGLRTLAYDFVNNLGPKLQWYLRLKSWWSSNYVSDWWEEYIYLVSRSSIVIDSNYYCLGITDHSNVTSKRQASRAAGVVSSLLHFRREINTQNLEPLLISNCVPLCTSQYDKIFNTTRKAQPVKDKLEHFDVSNHITVSYNGKYYKVYIYCNSRLASPREFERVFEIILNDTSEPVEGEEFIGVISAVDRETSAYLRGNYFTSGVNKESIELIDRAAFHLVLEDFDAKLDSGANSERLSLVSRRLYIGSGYDRWYEKSFNVIIFSDGHVSLISEHSWGDALVISHMLEASTCYEIQNIRYGEDGRIVSKNVFDCALINPIRLKFEFYNNLAFVLKDHAQRVSKEVNNLDLSVFRFEDFGRNFGRNNKLSLDSFIQLTLQLAYYRENNHFVHTYESASTQFFMEGRTETIRSCTQESCKFVLAMMDGKTDRGILRDLVFEALLSHQSISRLAVSGGGIDRHMFALLVVSKLLNKNSPFLDRVLNEKWGISSSQTPVAQTSNKIFPAYKKNVIGGGFGPTCFRGYGVSYYPCDESITFHVSCLKNAECRDATKFGEQIVSSVRDIADIITQT